ncbi:hypothetical protein BVRB_5g109800 [Beta vulgaris subsp. vulgaris]|nr:hypothetical protein BVRB_5g109800 [Beta vulgaris subsp. vulgaris]
MAGQSRKMQRTNPDGRRRRQRTQSLDTANKICASPAVDSK